MVRTRRSETPRSAQSGHNAKTFPEWLALQPRGVLTRLQVATGLSYSLVHRASRGNPVSLRAGVLLSQHTGLPLHAFCEDAPAGIRLAAAR